MRTAWFVRSRQVSTRLRYWLFLLGFDPLDRSLSQKLYGVYAVGFFAIWSFAMLSLTAGTIASGLRLLSPADPVGAAAITLAALTFVWFLYQFFTASRRSPLVFSEDDAHLICQTPISRPAVVFTWWAHRIVIDCILIWLAALAIGCSLAEIELKISLSWDVIVLYWGYGLRALAFILPLPIGLLALAWAWGLLRVRGVNRMHGLWLLPVLVGGGALFLLVTGRTDFLLNTYLWPFLAPARAGMNLLSAGAGLLPALVIFVAGILLLYPASRKVHLGVAALETSGADSASTAMLFGKTRQADDAQLEKRLVAGKLPEFMISGTGWKALLWKSIARTLRRLSWRSLYDGFLLLALALGIVLAPDWASRAVAMIFAMMQLQERVSANLRSDLEMWAVFRGLPLDLNAALLADVAVPASLLTLLGWLILPVGKLLGSTAPGWVALLLPGIFLFICLITAFDVTRDCETSLLLRGQAATPGAVSVLLTAAMVALLAFAETRLAALGLPAPLRYLFYLVVSLLASFVALDQARYAIRWIK